MVLKILEKGGSVYFIRNVGLKEKGKPRGGKRLRKLPCQACEETLEGLSLPALPEVSGEVNPTHRTAQATVAALSGLRQHLGEFPLQKGLAGWVCPMPGPHKHRPPGNSLVSLRTAWCVSSRHGPSAEAHRGPCPTPLGSPWGRSLPFYSTCNLKQELKK